MVKTNASQLLRQKSNDEREEVSLVKTKIEELKLALETADIAYEMFKQKCLMKFENLQNELTNLRENQTKIESNSTSNAISPQERHEFRRLARTVEEQSRSISDVDLRLQLLENVRYNGNLLWRIDDFSTRRQQTLSGEIHALHSAPCFTSEYGYKFCLRAYLDGESEGEGTHLSLFFVLMKTDHDNILEWPFQKKIKLTLINQQNRSRDLTKEILPKGNEESFQKPRKEMNIASGFPMFIEIDRLQDEGFLKDESLFFQLVVQSNNTCS